MAYFQDVPHIIEASDIVRVESVWVEETASGELVAHMTLVLSREGKFAGLKAGDPAPHTLHLTDGNHQWLHTAGRYDPTVVHAVEAAPAEHVDPDSEDAAEASESVSTETTEAGAGDTDTGNASTTGDETADE